MKKTTANAIAAGLELCAIKKLAQRTAPITASAVKTENASANQASQEKPAAFSSVKMSALHMAFAAKANASVKRAGAGKTAKNA